MIVVPLELPRIDIQRDSRIGKQSRAVPRPAARAHPGLGLRRPPVRQIEVGIIAAGDPGFSAHPEHVRKAAPTIASELACLGNGVELPKQLTGSGVIGADEALFVLIIRAARASEPLHDLALDNDRSAAGGVTILAAIPDGGVPDVPAGPRVERVDMRLARSDIDLVFEHRKAALRTAGVAF